MGSKALALPSVPMEFLELTNEKNRLHLAFLDGAAFVGQLGKRWHYKNQGDHRAALREEMLSLMVCSPLGQKCSPAGGISQSQFNLFPVLVTDSFDFGFCQHSPKSVTTSSWKYPLRTRTIWHFTGMCKWQTNKFIMSSKLPEHR